MPAMTDKLPFAGLTPELILAAVESLGLYCDGRLLAMNSYENRVWQVGRDEDLPLIAKFYRPARWSDAQIQEEHDFVWEMANAELPVVAPIKYAGQTLHHHAGFRFSLYPRRGGRAPELGDPAVLEWMGRLMARLHNIGAAKPFACRPALDADTFGYEVCEWLYEHGGIPDDVVETWAGVAAQALEEIDLCYERAGQVTTLRLHGDCHSGNVLWSPESEKNGGGPHFVDFDDARSGPAVQDLWMLLSGEADEMAGQLRHVLEGYELFRPFDRRELHLIEALRTLRLIHHAAWLARRWDDPAFPAAFPWFGGPRYWEDRVLELREQIARMQESALALRRF
jgi:Ser/Thr protein kinase RdoA (MazF antagonist)